MSLTGYIHSMETFGTVDGPGIRYVLFLQGCPLSCKYCHNRTSWDKSLGEQLTTKHIVSDINKYFSFYKNSGGGLTVSGGEPTLQIPFVTEVFKEVKAMGLNTALDTSGFVDTDKLSELMPVTDLVLLDIKAIDLQEHLDLTGVSNDKILNFAKYLSDIQKPVWIRHVLIPGLNDDHRHLNAFTDFVNSLTNIERVEILGYHKLGVPKWELCGQDDPLAYIQAAKPQEVEAVQAYLKAKGVKIAR